MGVGVGVGVPGGARMEILVLLLVTLAVVVYRTEFCEMTPQQRKWRRTVTATAAIVLTGWYLTSSVPWNVSSFLEDAERFELISLNPEFHSSAEKQDKEMLGRFPILGRAQIDDKSERRRLLNCFYNSTRGCRLGAMACFNPRHAIRAMRNGKTLTVLICFECRRYRVEGEYELADTISPFRESEFDDALGRAKLPRAKRHK